MLTRTFRPDPPAGLGRGVAAERLDRRGEPGVADQVEQRVEDTALEGGRRGDEVVGLLGHRHEVQAEGAGGGQDA
jgi:hypothetical protein